MADDHPDIVANATSGELYAVWKTEKSVVGDDKILFARRASSGTWTDRTVVWTRFGPSSGEHTRPRITYDESSETVYVFATKGNSGGDITYKTSDVNNVAFGPELVAISATNVDHNNVTVGRQAVNDASDLVVAAMSADNFVYYRTFYLTFTAPIITSTPVTETFAGRAYSYDVEATGSPVPTYTLTVAPSGMTISRTAGLISWTPTLSGSTDVTVVASNKAGTDSQSFTITVADAPTVLRDLFAHHDFENNEAPGWINGSGNPLNGWVTAGPGLNSSSYRLDGTFTSSASSNFRAVREWPTAVSSGILTITFTAKSHGEATTRGLAASITDASLSGRQVSVIFASNGWIRYGDSTAPGGFVNLQTYSPNTEYDFILAVNVDNQTVDIWIDGTQRASSIPYADTSAGDPKLVVFDRYSPDSPSGTAQLDDVSAVATVCAPDKVWGGSLSNNWNVANNWFPVGVPSSSENIHVTSGDVLLNANTAVNCVYVASGASLNLGTNNFAVEYAVTNYGTLTQTQDVPVNTLTEFLHIKNSAGTATKYQGVDITSNPGIDLVNATVAIRAVDTTAGEFCTLSGAGSDPYAERCFTITPNTDGPATVRLWALDSEQNTVLSSLLTPHRFTAGGWLPLSSVSRTGVDSNNYVSAEGGTPGFSSFLLGSPASPTAINLASFQAVNSVTRPAYMVLLLTLAGLAVVSAIIWRKRFAFRRQ
jgi:hypothetical protein